MRLRLTSLNDNDGPPVNIYSPYERKRLSVATLLRKAGVESPLFNMIILRGVIMKITRGKIWIATSSGYWKVRIAGTENMELHTELAMLCRVFPSFNGVVLFGYELKEGAYHELIELSGEYIKRASAIAGAQISIKIKQNKEKRK